MISNMTINDLDEIKDILYTHFDDFWNYNIFKSELENSNSKYLVAKRNNEIVGFGGILKAVDDVHVTNIVTKKYYRKCGIASLILEKLIQMAKNMNVNSITLEVHEDNVAAQKLYTKYNFKEVGNRKNYYKNKSAIIMTLYF